MTTASTRRHVANTDFAVSAIDMRVVWLLPGIALLAALIGTLLLAQRQPVAWVMLPASLAIIGVLVLILRRRHVRIDNDTLVIAAGLNTRRVAIGDLDPASARVVDLRERMQYKPAIKLFGTRVPGLSMGHFRLRDRSRAFVLVTDPTRVLLLDERSGRHLLLSLENPQALLAALGRSSGMNT